jgi:hypothetical protein
LTAPFMISVVHLCAQHERCEKAGGGRDK